MAQYRFLQSAYVADRYYEAGLVTTMPADWVPGPFVEPIDGEALAAFYAAGPQAPVLTRMQWGYIPSRPARRLFGLASIQKIPSGGNSTGSVLTCQP